MRKTRRNSPPLTESEKRGFKDTNNKIVQAFGGDATRQSTKFAPQSPKQAKKEKEIMASEKRRAKRNKIRRVTNAITTGGGSEIVRKIAKSSQVKNFIKGAKKSIKGVIDFAKNNPDAMATGGAYKRQRDKDGNYRPIVKGSSFKMKGFSGFGNESPAKMKFDPARDVVNFREGVAYTPKGKVKVDKISRKPANAAQKSFRNFKNAASVQKTATGKIGRKVATKLGGKLLGPVGAALAVKDAIGSYKDIKKGMKPGKAARKNFLGF